MKCALERERATSGVDSTAARGLSAYTPETRIAMYDELNEAASKSNQTANQQATVFEQPEDVWKETQKKVRDNLFSIVMHFTWAMPTACH